MIQQLNPRYLEKLLNNECDVLLYREGLSEEGEPLTSIDLKDQKCRFVEKTKIIINHEGKKVELLGKVILLGDVSVIPEKKFTVKEINDMEYQELDSQSVRLKTQKLEVKKVSGGIVKINGSQYEIYQASKPRNPDGTVYMTVLELM